MDSDTNESSMSNDANKSFPDTEDPWSSELSSSVSSHSTTVHMSTMPPIPTPDQKQKQQEIFPVQIETISISSGDDSPNEEQRQQQQQQHETSISSQEWRPLAASTPFSTITTNDPRSDPDIENDFFNDIEKLVRKFLARPNRLYPYYRVMRWIIGEQPKVEHLVTIVINRPTILL